MNVKGLLHVMHEANSSVLITPNPLYFEAASVKPSEAQNPGIGIRRQPGGRFNTVNAPVKLLITFAYQIQDYQLSGGPEIGRAHV